MTEKKVLHVVDEPDRGAIAPVTVGNPRKASDLSISQDHMEEFATADEGPNEVSCAKPNSTAFFTTWPEVSKPWQNRRFYFWMEVKDRDPFLVAEPIAKLKKQAGETIIRPVLIVRYVTMAEEEGLWALKLDLEGKTNDWNKSARTILKLADEGKWMRMLSGKGQYNHIVSPVTFKDTPPKFSSRSFDDLINNAFSEDQVVLDGSHEIWDVLARGQEEMNNDGREIVCNRFVSWDSEFDAKKDQGEPPGPPVCICAVEIDSQGHITEHRLKYPYPKILPWDHGPSDPYLAIVYSGGAEAGSAMHVSWPFPLLTVDLYAEFMVVHNSEMVKAGGENSKPPGPSLINACKRYGVTGMDEDHKKEMRALVYTKTNHTPEEIADIQDYCIEDCWMGVRLFKAMRHRIDFLRAPLRGDFMMEIARMHWRGIPIDMPTYNLTKQRAGSIVSTMREDLNQKLEKEARKILRQMHETGNPAGNKLEQLLRHKVEVYFHDVFKRRNMLALMHTCGIPLPVDPKTKKFSCATRQVKSMIGTHPLLHEYYEDKRMIDAMKNLSLEIGSDGRNRCWLNPFGTKTGRSNPSTNKYVFGLPHTMRSYIKPSLGWAVGQVDIGCEEVGIAATLSGDPMLLADYLTGDPYKQFARDALGILDPTKKQRAAYKAVVLGRIYGKGVESIARDLGISRQHAQQIFDQMNARYPVLNAWLKRVLAKAAHAVPIVCTLGWNLTSDGRKSDARTFLNFPMQANGAELMRLIVVRASQAGLRLIGCAHDSFMIEAPIAEIEADIVKLQDIMRQASRDLFGGFELRADCDPDEDIVRYPDRFIDKREAEEGMKHWNRLMNLIGITVDEKEEVA